MTNTTPTTRHLHLYATAEAHLREAYGVRRKIESRCALGPPQPEKQESIPPFVAMALETPPWQKHFADTAQHCALADSNAAAVKLACAQIMQRYLEASLLHYQVLSAPATLGTNPQAVFYSDANHPEALVNLYKTHLVCAAEVALRQAGLPPVEAHRMNGRLIHTSYYVAHNNLFASCPSIYHKTEAGKVRPMLGPFQLLDKEKDEAKLATRLATITGFNDALRTSLESNYRKHVTASRGTQETGSGR